MHDTSSGVIARFLGDMIEDHVDGKIQVRLSKTNLLKQLASFLTRKKI